MIFDKIKQEKRREHRQRIREAKIAARELHIERRKERINEKFKEGGIVYPARFKYNRRRILLLTKLRIK